MDSTRILAKKCIIRDGASARCTHWKKKGIAMARSRNSSKRPREQPPKKALPTGHGKKIYLSLRIGDSKKPLISRYLFNFPVSSKKLTKKKYFVHSVPLSPPPVQPVRPLQLPRIRQTADERCLSRAQGHGRRAASAGAGPAGAEGVADAKGIITCIYNYIHPPHSIPSA